MTPLDALVELLARVGACNGSAMLISETELRNWPPEAVAALKSQKLLARARPAISVVCPGCERECVMLVQTVLGQPRRTTSFVVCDKRSDVNRVLVSNEQLAQWRCDADAVCEFVATALALRRSREHGTNPGILNIGMASGAKRRQMLGLRVVGEVELVAGDKSQSVAEFAGFSNGRYSLDEKAARELVDSATTANPRYTPSNARREAQKLDTHERHESWRKAYRDLKRRRRQMSDSWCAQQIAKMEIANGRSPATIRKHLKK
jgi:hypothetical protein